MLSHLRTLAVISLCILTVGCATTPKDRFAEFYEPGAHDQNIDVVIDTIVLSDISGSDIGFNRNKNAEAVQLVDEHIPTLLNQHGFTPNLVFHGNGAFMRLNENTEYFYSENFSSTEEVFAPPAVPEAYSAWQDEEVKAFMTKLIEQATFTNSNNKNSQNFDFITHEEIPAVIKELPSSQLAYVRVNAGEVSMGKTIGVGLLTGLLSAALSGGTYIYVSAAASGSYIDMVVFDKEKAEVVWHNGKQGPKYTNITMGLDNVLADFPTLAEQAPLEDDTPDSKPSSTEETASVDSPSSETTSNK